MILVLILVLLILLEEGAERRSSLSLRRGHIAQRGLLTENPQCVARLSD
jgi:hypothetical protein